MFIAWRIGNVSLMRADGIRRERRFCAADAQSAGAVAEARARLGS